MANREPTPEELRQLTEHFRAVSGARRRFAVAKRIAIAISVTFIALCGYAGWEYASWRRKMIEWDTGTINRLCGGDTSRDRLLQIRFVGHWEYKALKRTDDGENVWLHWKLSKRHCGNWMLVDPHQQALIRPFDVRFPNGAPPRGAVDCLGLPLDENELFRRRDEKFSRLGPG